jgi:hypothetical protein
MLAVQDTLLVVVVMVLMVIMYQAILSIEGIPTRIIYGLAIFTNAKSNLAWIVVAVAAMVAVVGVIAVITCCLACGVILDIYRTVLWDLCFWLCYWVYIAIIYAQDMASSLSCAQWLFVLASVSLDRLGGAATIDRGPHLPDGKL